MATPSIVQHAGQYFGNASSGTLTFANPTNNGDMFLVCVMYNTVSSVAVTDSQGDTFQLTPTGAGFTTFPFAVSNGFNEIACYFTNNIAGGASTSITITMGSSVFFEAWAIEISGQDATAPIDKTSAAAATSGSANSGAQTTSGADLVLGFFQGSGNPIWTPTGGFTSLQQLNSTNSLATSFSQSSAGSIAATATAASSTWGAAMVGILGSTATLTSITVTPSPASVTVPQTVQMTATGHYSDTSHHIITNSVTWSSSNTSVATVSSAGVATGVSAGSATLTATQGVSGSATINVSPQIVDQFYGLIGLPCTNSHTAFSIAQVGNRKVFCTPAGHGMFARGFYIMNPGLEADPDESGNSYLTYIQAKYGGGSQSQAIQNWTNPALEKITTWGMNMIPPTYGGSTLYSFSSPVINLPYVYVMFTSAYALVNKDGWGTGPVKDLIYYIGGSGKATTWGGSTPSGMTDYGDPNFGGMVTGILNNDGNLQTIASTTTANKNYILGIATDDSDTTHCFGAGPDFTTQPSGENDYRCGYVSLFVPPVSYANSHQAQIYTNPVVYMKQLMYNSLLTKYSTFTALNAAWGSSYTTLGTSGACFGGSMSFPCASTGAATAVGTGTGVALTFSATLANTTVSSYSVGIFVAGVLVGGDTGAGAIYGPELTGSINYATGALSLTFASGHAPANGAAITANYIQNGFGIGTGFMDEDCRASHSAYCGTGSGGPTGATVTLTGVAAAAQTDVNVMTQTWANTYATTIKTKLNAWSSANGFVGPILNFGPNTLGTWTTPPDRYVIAGMCGSIDLMITGGQGTFTQAEIDFINTACPGLPQIAGSYRTSNADSPYSWPNSACTHSGASVTCTLTTPHNFTTGSLIDVTCNNSDYNLVQSRPTATTSTTVTYTAHSTPSESSAICNVFWDDNNVGGYPSQAVRAAAFQSAIEALPATSYTATGVQPYVGYFWWQYTDNEAEQLNWGVVTVRDNNYDCSEDVMGVVGCQPPTASFFCGGELRHNRGCVIAAITATNAFLDNALLAGPVLPPGVGPIGIF